MDIVPSLILITLLWHGVLCEVKIPKIDVLNETSINRNVIYNTVTYQAVLVRDCSEILVYFPQAKSGVYTIYPIPGKASNVYCDMDYRGGGWTTIQRRGERLGPNKIRQDFFLDWANYEMGFGDANYDYWLGLTVISALTRIQDSELYIELVDWDGNVRTANYKGFRVGDSLDEYQLTVKDYTGNAGDSLSRKNGMKFSTRDRDQDIYEQNCASQFKGGWWYDKCHLSNLNGLYAPEGSNGQMVDYAVGIIWHSWKEYHYSLKEVRMKIRSKAIAA